jgi:hypothetical protein
MVPENWPTPAEPMMSESSGRKWPHWVLAPGTVPETGVQFDKLTMRKRAQPRKNKQLKSHEPESARMPMTSEGVVWLGMVRFGRQGLVS